MKYYLGLVSALFAGLLVSSCGSLSQENANASAIGYEMLTFKVSSSPECAPPAKCAVFEVSYPDFSGLDSTVERQLAERIDFSFAMGDSSMAGRSVSEIGNDFIASYNEITKELGESGTGWTYKGQAAVNLISDSLISIGVDEEYYTGGAHGGTGRYFINIDPRTGKEIRLEDVLKPDFRPALTKIGEELFRRQRALADTSSYNNEGFMFENDQFSLNSNYGFTPAGIIFYYNNYEVAPFAAGPTEIIIPYERIKDWLKNDQPVL